MSGIDLQTEALRTILLHTASDNWNDVKDMNWTTAEMLDVISKALLRQANGVTTGEEQCNLPVVSVSNFSKDEFELMKYATWVLLRQTEATTPRFPRLNKLKQKLEELYKNHYSR